MRDKKKKAQNSQGIYRYPKGMKLRAMQDSLIENYLGETSTVNQNRKAAFKNQNLKIPRTSGVRKSCI